MADRRGNPYLRAAREHLPSARIPGEPLSRAELAELINTWLWTHTGRRFALDDHAIARWERGRVGWPIAPYRAALRAVLGVATDTELGLHRPHCVPEPTDAASAQAATGAVVDASWATVTILDVATAATEQELISRRDAVRGLGVASGAALLAPLGAWLEPLAGEAFTTRQGTFSVEEVEALENVTAVFRGWRAPGSGLGRTAVVGQLSDVAARLDGAPADRLTDRVFLVGAELAKIAGSMAFDEGRVALAQRYYVTAVQMAKAGNNSSFGAVVIAALARQSFDVGKPGDGAELIALAQRGSVGAATPALRALLATREAWGYAVTGSVYRFRRAVDAAETAHTDVNRAAEPRWLHGLDQAELAGVIGARYRDLAHHDPGQARHAVAYLQQALDWRDPGKRRNRGFDLVSLARVHLITGDHDRAAATVVQALPLLDHRRPGRLARKLTDWRNEATPRASIPAIRAAWEAVAERLSAVS